MTMQFGVARMQAAGEAAQVTAFTPNGIQEQSLPFILSTIREGRHDSFLMNLADQWLRAAGNDGRARGDLDVVKRAQVLLDAHRAQTSYAPDPIGTELIKKPHVTYCLKNQCVPIGDCDDGVAALGAVMASIGVSVYIVTQKFGAGQQEHVLLGIEDESNVRWYVDPSTNDPVYRGSRARSEQWINPLDTASAATGAAGAEFVTLGAPHRGTFRRMNAGMQCGIGRAPAPGFGIIVTPSDILAYRKMWDAYVLDTARVALACGQAYSALASKDPDPNAGKLEGDLGTSLTNEGNDLVSLWNLYQGKADSFIVLQGASILESFQKTVLRAGDIRANVTANQCALTYPDANGKLIPATPGADTSVQTQVIAHIEGLGILGGGILQILVGTAENSLMQAGSAAQWAGKQVEKVTSAATSPWTWVGIAAAAAATLGLVYAPEIKAALKARPAKKAPA
jgi:hypothetical protein